MEEAFLCPILHTIMRDPVIAMDGKTYERSAVFTWFADHNTSPWTNKTLTSLGLIANLTLREAIEAWLKENPEAKVRLKDPLPISGQTYYLHSLRHEEGKWTKVDRRRAHLLLCKAAECGYVLAQKRLARYFEHIEIYAQALHWWRAAADQRDAEAEYMMGMLFTRGVAVDRDMESAAYWFRRASEQGLGAAQIALGLLRLTGQGVSKDEVKALALFRQAAFESKDAFAYHHIGHFYECGLGGLSLDEKEAVRLYQLGANAQVPDSMACFGRMLVEGKGIERDMLRGLDMLDKAVQAGSNEARRYLDSSVTLRTIRCIKRASRAWLS